jgi:hypothetical protein
VGCSREALDRSPGLGAVTRFPSSPSQCGFSSATKLVCKAATGVERFGVIEQKRRAGIEKPKDQQAVDRCLQGHDHRRLFLHSANAMGAGASMHTRAALEGPTAITKRPWTLRQSTDCKLRRWLMEEETWERGTTAAGKLSPLQPRNRAE